MKYRNPECTTEERIEDLISIMSFEQKIDQLTCLVTITDSIPDFSKYIPNGIGNVGAFTVADNVEIIAEYVNELQKYQLNNTELGIPVLIHCEASAGAQYTEANVFPSAIAQASTFDTDIVGKMFEIIRGQMHDIGFRQALSPVVDVTRDPRWGRVSETYGEDPTLTAEFASVITKALQTKDLRNGVAVTAKHFVGHGVTEGGLNMGRNLVSDRDLREIHCKPFQCAITEGNLSSVMSSYCSLNGEPVSASHRLLTDILRKEMGFNGIVVSDYVALDRLVDPFHVADSYDEAGVRAINAGLDVEYPRPKAYTYNMRKAVEDGRVSMITIDNAVKNVLRVKFNLGLFEDPYPDVASLKNKLHVVETDKVNEKAAEESFILLKNDDHTLPLSKNTKRIAVIGPHANRLRSMFGTFSYPATLDMTMAREDDGQKYDEPGLIVYDINQEFPGQIREPSPKLEKKLREAFPKSRTLYQAISELLPYANVKYSKGIDFAGQNYAGVDDALRIAAEADVIILTLGGKNGWGITSTVGEGVDSTNIDLPGRQEEFARKVYELHKKTVILHFDGRPLSNEYVASHFKAILEVWQPGEMGGQALAKVLFGEYNPAGRLPVTAARNVGQLPVYYSLPRGSGYVAAGHTGMIRNPNGYINDVADPLYHFGHGLSYTEFAYTDLKTDKDEYGSDETVRVSVKISNTGDYDGDEIVQLYISDETASMVRPTMELAGFSRISLKKQNTSTIEFSMKVSQMAFIGEDNQWIVEKGKISIMIGAASDDIRLFKEIKIKDTKVINCRTRGFYATVRQE